MASEINVWDTESNSSSSSSENKRVNMSTCDPLCNSKPIFQNHFFARPNQLPCFFNFGGVSLDGAEDEGRGGGAMDPRLLPRASFGKFFSSTVSDRILMPGKADDGTGCNCVVDTEDSKLCASSNRERKFERRTRRNAISASRSDNSCFKEAFSNSKSLTLMIILTKPKKGKNGKDWSDLNFRVL